MSRRRLSQCPPRRWITTDPDPERRPVAGKARPPPLAPDPTRGFPRSLPPVRRRETDPHHLDRRLQPHGSLRRLLPPGDCLEPFPGLPNSHKGLWHPLRFCVDTLRISRFVQGRDSFLRRHVLQTDEADPQRKQAMQVLGVDVTHVLSPRLRARSSALWLTPESDDAHPRLGEPVYSGGGPGRPPGRGRPPLQTPGPFHHRSHPRDSPRPRDAAGEQPVCSIAAPWPYTELIDMPCLREGVLSMATRALPRSTTTFRSSTSL